MARVATEGLDEAGDCVPCCPCSTAGMRAAAIRARRRIDEAMRGGYLIGDCGLRIADWRIADLWIDDWIVDWAAAPPCRCDLHMATTAEQTIVLQAALAAAVRDRDDVVRLPARTRLAPALARGPIGGRRLRARPRAVRLDDVDAAQA